MLVGREILLGAGELAVERMQQGHGRLLLVAGEAGMGKTSLALALADRAAAAGAVVRTGACWEHDTLPPFTPWLDALARPGGDACARAGEALAGHERLPDDAAGAERALGRRHREVVEALREVSGDRPQVIVLEDLHWADAPSLDLLAAVAARLPSMPVLVVGTYRDDEMPRSTPLASIGGNADHLVVDGLGREAVARLLGEVLGRPPEPGELERVVAQTSGNPLFVVQVGRLLASGGGSLPVGVRQVLERRLARTSAACDRVLGAASVLGAELDGAVLEEVLEGPAGDSLDEAASARLLEPVDDTGRRWRFVHALLQEARYDGLGRGERAELHRRALRAFERRPGQPAALLAHHAARADLDPGGTELAALLVRAGDEASGRLAWAEAADAYERALTRAPPGREGDEIRVEAWLGLGGARLRTGADDAPAAFDEAAALARRLARPDLSARAALGLSVGLGAFEVRLLDRRQIELLEDAAAALPEDHALLPLVLARLSVALAFVESTERRAVMARRAVDLARARGDPVALGHALCARCDADSGPGAVDSRLAAATEVVALARAAADRPLELLGRRHLVVARLEVGDDEAADREIRAYASVAEALGDPLYSWYAALWGATRALSRGDLEEAEAAADRAAALGAAGGSINSEILTATHRGMSALARGEPAAAEAAAAVLDQEMSGIGRTYAVLFEALAAATLGEPERAHAVLDSLGWEAIDALPRDSEWLPTLVQVAQASGRSGHVAMARAVEPELALWPDVWGIEGIGAYQHGPPGRHSALVSAVLGDPAATRAHVERALASRCGALLRALTELDCAHALLIAGDVADRPSAARLARRAAAALTAMGLDRRTAEAEALAARAEAWPTEAEARSVEAEAGAGGADPAPGEPTAGAGPGAALRRRGDTWEVTWEGQTFSVRHAKGIADLAQLLERPGRDVHVRELEGVGAAVPSSRRPDAVLDGRALAEARRRLRELEEDLDAADRAADAGRAALVAAERDALLEHLSGALGLGGRVRRLPGDPDERLRKAVSARVRSSIERLEGLSAPLGRHLRASVRTGFWCAYEPERAVTWHVDR